MLVGVTYEYRLCWFPFRLFTRTHSSLLSTCLSSTSSRSDVHYSFNFCVECECIVYESDSNFFQYWSSVYDKVKFPEFEPPTRVRQETVKSFVQHTSAQYLQNADSKGEDGCKWYLQSPLKPEMGSQIAKDFGSIHSAWIRGEFVWADRSGYFSVLVAV